MARDAGSTRKVCGNKTPHSIFLVGSRDFGTVIIVSYHADSV
jgi:hypothetical protein